MAKVVVDAAELIKRIKEACEEHLEATQPGNKGTLVVQLSLKGGPLDGLKMSRDGRDVVGGVINFTMNVPVDSRKFFRRVSYRISDNSTAEFNAQGEWSD